MRKILLLLMFPIIAIGQNITKEEREKLSQEIFDSLSEKEKQKAFVEILGLDDFAIDKALNSHPNNNDWEARFNKQRSLEGYWRKKWYAKQKWWNKAKENEDVAYSVRAKIAVYGLKNNWDTTIYSKKGKILKPPKF